MEDDFALRRKLIRACSADELRYAASCGCLLWLPTLGRDQNRHARIKFIGSNSDAAAFKRLDGFSDDPCDFQPTHVAERQEQLIDV
jgi:hypothetical protein